MRIDQLRSQPLAPESPIQAPASGVPAQAPAAALGDQLVRPGEGAPVVLPKGEASVSIGRHGHKPSGPKTLSARELASIAKVGGVGLRGRGALEGKISVREGHPLLVTAGHGRSEVAFRLDLPLGDARAIAGQTVTVRGVITKTKPRLGKVTGAELVANVANAVAIGSFQRLSGRVENRQIMGIGAEAPPSGSYLVLDQPITVDGGATTAVYLQGKELADGAQATLFGKLAYEAWGGVETRGGKVVMLSGVCDLSAGEPTAQDGVFKNKDGATLTALAYRKPEMYDAPGKVFVLDGDSVFVGSQGGRFRPDLNGFHGFSARLTIEQPTDADRAQVTFGPDEKPRNAAGTELTQISEPAEGPVPYPDFMATTWYYDAENRKAYAFENGGIAGFHDRMSAVIREQ